MKTMQNHTLNLKKKKKKNIIVKIDHEFAVFNRLVSIRQRLEILWWNEKQFLSICLINTTNKQQYSLFNEVMDGCLLWRPSTGIQDHPLTLHHEKLKLYYTNNKNRHAHAHTHMHLIIVLQDMLESQQQWFPPPVCRRGNPPFSPTGRVYPHFYHPSRSRQCPAGPLHSCSARHCMWRCGWRWPSLGAPAGPHSSRRHPDCGRNETRPCGGAASAHTPDDISVDVSGWVCRSSIFEIEKVRT